METDCDMDRVAVADCVTLLLKEAELTDVETDCSVGEAVIVFLALVEVLTTAITPTDNSKTSSNSTTAPAVHAIPAGLL